MYVDEVIDKWITEKKNKLRTNTLMFVSLTDLNFGISRHGIVRLRKSKLIKIFVPH